MFLHFVHVISTMFYLFKNVARSQAIRAHRSLQRVKKATLAMQSTMQRSTHVCTSCIAHKLIMKMCSYDYLCIVMEPQVSVQQSKHARTSCIAHTMKMKICSCD